MHSTAEESIEIIRLIEAVIEDVKQITSEAIIARTKVIALANETEARNWESELFSNLTCTFTSSKIYQKYIEQYHHGVDPLDCEEWTHELLALVKSYKNK